MNVRYRPTASAITSALGGSCLCTPPSLLVRAPCRHRQATMFDPLSVPNFPQDEPPWPTTPHSPNDPIPNLPRPSPHHQESRGPPSGLYGKEPQIYGQPEPGLISPRANASSNGTPFEKKEPYLRVRITSLDRNRRDVLIKFDAQVRSLSQTCIARQLTKTHITPIFIRLPSAMTRTDEPLELHGNDISQYLPLLF